MPTDKKLRELCACGCGRQVSKVGYKFYSNQCQVDLQYRVYVERWKAGQESGTRGRTGLTSKHIKRYLYAKYNARCSECGWSQRNIVTGSIPLEIDHINGNAFDNRETNLRLLCPNCHSLTSNFRNLNKGNGRLLRK